MVVADADDVAVDDDQALANQVGWSGADHQVEKVLVRDNSIPC